MNKEQLKRGQGIQEEIEILKQKLVKIVLQKKHLEAGVKMMVGTTNMYLGIEKGSIEFDSLIGFYAMIESQINSEIKKLEKEFEEL